MDNSICDGRDKRIDILTFKCLLRQKKSISYTYLFFYKHRCKEEKFYQVTFSQTKYRISGFQKNFVTDVTG